MNNLSNNFRKHLSSEQKAQHAKLSRDEKRRWLLQWVIDPETCSREGFNRSVAYNSDENISDAQWITNEQLAGPHYLNSLAHAEIITAAGDLEEQPSRYPSLASKGIKEYRVATEILRSLQGAKSESGVSASSELKSSEYVEAKASIDNGFGKPAARRATKQEKPAEGPLAKEVKDTLAKRSSLLRQMKRAIDAYDTQMDCVRDVQIPKLGGKGFPDAMLAFYREKLADLEMATQKAAYATEVIKKDNKDPAALTSMKSDMCDLEALLTDATEHKQAWDKGHGNDLKKLVA